MARYDIPPHVISRSVGDDTVLLDLHQDEYFSLDRVGTEIWTQLQDGADTTAIVDSIVASYGVERATVESDVAKLIDELVQSKLLTELG